MKTATHWNDRYCEKDLPWDTQRIDYNLEQVVNDYRISPCRVLEIGCGTGTNARWLAEMGFDVLGLDIAARAVDIARERTCASNTVCFITADILHYDHGDERYDFVVDRGCFHSFSELEHRRAYVQKVRGLLVPNGLWFSLIGRKDGRPHDSGPPRLSAVEIAEAMEDQFEILQLKASHFDSDEHPEAWACLFSATSL